MKPLTNILANSRLRLLLMSLALGMGTSTFAQDKFGLWTEAGFDKAISKKVSFGMDLGFRANDNVGEASRFDLGAGFTYKPVRGLKFGLGYVLIDQHNPREVKAHFNSSGNWNGFNVEHDFWRLKNRFYFDATGKLDIGRFSFSLRERYQATVYNAKHVDRDKYRGIVTEDYDGEKIYGEYDGTGRWYALDENDDDYKEAKTKQHLRSRLGVEWNIRHCNVDPFATFEVSNNLTEGFSLDKKRLTAGVDWKLNKQHTITAAYVYTSGDDDDDEGNLHALSISYKFKF